MYLHYVCTLDRSTTKYIFIISNDSPVSLLWEIWLYVQRCENIHKHKTKHKHDVYVIYWLDGIDAVVFVGCNYTTNNIK